MSARFGSTYTKIGTIQRRLAWLLHKDDMQISKALHIFKQQGKSNKYRTRESPKRLSAGLSAETLQARREWQDIFKVMKGKNLQPRLLYPARLSFRFDGEIKALQTSKS